MKETQTRHNKKRFTEYIPQTCPAFWIFACPRIANLFRSAERGQGRGASSWPATQLELPGMILRSHPTKLKHWTPLERVQQALRTNKHTAQMHAHPIRDPYEPRTGAGSESITGHTQLCGCPAQSHQRDGPNTWPVLRCWAACTIWAQKLRYFVLAAFFSPTPHDNDDLSQILWLWEESHQLYVKTQSQCTWQTARQRRASGRDISQFANNWIFYGFVKKLSVFHPF